MSLLGYQLGAELTGYVGSEIALQDAIEASLRRHEVPYVREHRLSPRDRVDFFVCNAFALEVKVDGGLSLVTRQLHRYAQHETVRGLILVTTRAQHRALPLSITGKALEVVHLIGASL